MPASPQSSGTAGSIVLIEEYGALAVAIGSALKKFAPGFSTRTVGSFEDAETTVSERKPDLLVVDFDPPQAGALEFFLRLQSTAPSCRVIVIAAAPLSELATRRTPGAFRFVEKPFDLASLGAGVQAVVGAAAAGHRAAMMRDFSLRDVIPLQCLAGQTGVLKLDAAEGRSGEVHFINGQISHAETTDIDGADALREILAWQSPRLKQPKRKPRVARTIEGNWTSVLAEALTRASEASAEPEATPGEQAPERVGGGKKIVVVDDTEMLLVFVEDSLATADPTLEIVTAASGSEGVERILATKPDLVLLDYSLPDFNGDEVCDRLLADPATAAIPIIMMSGHVPEMGASALRFENIVATIAKPFLSEALVEMVSKALADPAQFAVRSLAKPAPPAPASPAPTAKPPEPAAEPRSNGHRKTSPPAPAEIVSSSATATAPTSPPAAPSAIAPPPPPAIALPPVIPPAAPITSAPPPVTTAATVAAAAPVALAPPPVFPKPAPAPAAKPATTPAAKPAAVQRAPSVAVAPQPTPVISAPLSQPAAVPLPTAAAPARIAAATTNAVVIGIALEVVAIQFSATLQMAAIRARPASRTISLHVEAGALPGMTLPETGFELGPVDLDARGQIATIRLLPTAQQISAIQPRNAFPVGGVSVLPWNGGKAVELTPAAAAPMMMQLSAPFELAGVELSPTFGVRSLVLKARGGAIRVSLDREAGGSSATFKTAQVLLNRSAQIAEILLDAVA